ncbi:MAG: methyltransferase domain-containing protein [Patescibacteria group bacterium]
MNEIAQQEKVTGTGGFLQPERIMANFELRPGMMVADFGAGGGYFSIPAARLVGENGKVWAIDVQKQATDLIKSRANLEHLPQLETVWADLELAKGSRLPDNAVDLVIVANILFQAEKKKEVLAEARRVIRSGGRLAILEWDDTPFPAGPSPALRLTQAAARRLAEEAGFTLEKEFDAGLHHYGLLLRK